LLCEWAWLLNEGIQIDSKKVQRGQPLIIALLYLIPSKSPQHQIASSFPDTTPHRQTDRPLWPVSGSELEASVPGCAAGLFVAAGGGGAQDFWRQLATRARRVRSRVAVRGDRRGRECIPGEARGRLLRRGCERRRSRRAVI
jgi:hypothetical protein